MSNRFIQTVISCCICKGQRKDANHWFLLRVGMMLPEPSPTPPLDPNKPVYSVFRLDPDNPPLKANYFPVCGEVCLGKLESRVIEGKNLP
jgi:hypothetical protein